MSLPRHSSMTAAAMLSLAVSVVLGMAPFVWPGVPIGPFILANWLTVVLVACVALLPARSRNASRPNIRLFKVVMIAFAVAGWVASFKAETMF